MRKVFREVNNGVSVITKRNAATLSNANYCMDLVKNHDYENFVTTLLLRRDARTCAFAVRSFNVEVSRIAEQVTQKEAGLMRIQFWEDVVSRCFLNEISKVPQHPVAIELFKAVHNHRLTKRNLKNLLSSRKENFNVNGFKTIEDMEKYLERSVSSVYYLILEGCGIKDINADHAASHLGKAQGIVQQLRSVPISQRLNFIPVPQELLTKYGVSHEELFRCKPSNALADCVYEVASRAHQHVMKAQSLRENVPVDGRSAFLPAIATFAYLDRLQKVDYNIFHPKLKYRPWNLLFQLWLSNFRNQY